MSKVYFNHTSRLGITKEGIVPPCTIALTKIGNRFHYGVAICSKYDNFSKKYGRELAEKRMENLFGNMEVPKNLRDLPEKQACLLQLYNLTESVVIKNKKWKNKINKFNQPKEIVGKVIPMMAHTHETA